MILNGEVPPDHHQLPCNLSGGVSMKYQVKYEFDVDQMLIRSHDASLDCSSELLDLHSRTIGEKIWAILVSGKFRESFMIAVSQLRLTARGTRPLKVEQHVNIKMMVYKNYGPTSTRKPTNTTAVFLWAIGISPMVRVFHLMQIWRRIKTKSKKCNATS